MGEVNATKEQILAEIARGKDLLWMQSKFGYSTLAKCVEALKHYGIDTKPLFQQLDNRNKSVNLGIEDCFKKPLLKVDIRTGKAISRLRNYWENTNVRTLEVGK